MDESHKCKVEWKKTDIKGQAIWFILYKVQKHVKTSLDQCQTV